MAAESPAFGAEDDHIKMLRVSGFNSEIFGLVWVRS